MTGALSDRITRRCSPRAWAACVDAAAAASVALADTEEPPAGAEGAAAVALR